MSVWFLLAFWGILTHNNLYIGSEMDFHFIRYLWNEFCVFISPSLWRGDIKHTTSFINTVWNENSLHILFITCLTRKNVRKTGVFFYQFYCENAPTSGRYLWRHRRTATFRPIKCFPALCHKLIIYEIEIFNSINGETCDKCKSFFLNWSVSFQIVSFFFW